MAVPDEGLCVSLVELHGHGAVVHGVTELVELGGVGGPPEVQLGVEQGVELVDSKGLGVGRVRCLVVGGVEE